VPFTFLLVYFAPFIYLFLLIYRSEALHYSGALDRVKLSDEQSTLLTGFKEEAMRQAANYRQQVHRRLNPGTIQTFVQRQRNMALGLAGGAFVGILL
jgi:hypothetical protein